MFNFKNKQDDIQGLQDKLTIVRAEENFLETILKYATYELDRYIESIKGTKLVEYHKAIKYMANKHLENSLLVRQLII